MAEEANEGVVALTADIVSAYVANNSIKAEELAGLISSVHAALAGAGKEPVEEAPTYAPAVPVKKSVTPDFIHSLIDGKKYKSLKRHLTTQGLTPDEYRSRYGLPKDYPMVAANYSAQRSSLAKTLGLGRRAAEEAPAAEPAPAPKGRKKAAA